MVKVRSYSCNNATSDFGYNSMTFEKGLQIEVKSI